MVLQYFLSRSQVLVLSTRACPLFSDHECLLRLARVPIQSEPILDIVFWKSAMQRKGEDEPTRHSWIACFAKSNETVPGFTPAISPS